MEKEKARYSKKKSPKNDMSSLSFLEPVNKLSQRDWFLEISIQHLDQFQNKKIKVRIQKMKDRRKGGPLV